MYPFACGNWLEFKKNNTSCRLTNQEPLYENLITSLTSKLELSRAHTPRVCTSAIARAAVASMICKQPSVDEFDDPYLH